MSAVALLRAFVIVGAAALAAGAFGLSATSGRNVLRLPRIELPLKMDGELDDAFWQAKVARTGPFADGKGAPGRPYSDAWLAWGKGKLVLALYAADEDIRSSGASRDAFHVVVGDKAFDVGPAGDAPNAPGGTDIAREHDGTLDDSANDDEEWVTELTIPLAALGLRGEPGEATDFAVSRCDTPKGGLFACGAWRGRIVLAGAP
jgi:hypothetical protein